MHTSLGLEISRKKLVTVTMLEGILRKRKIIMEEKKKVHILIRKIINANNMNSYKKTLYNINEYIHNT
jgi:hypothetical protein